MSLHIKKILTHISFAFIIAQHTGQTWSQGGLVRNKKNKSAADDFNDDQSGHVYPRWLGLLSNEQSTKSKLRTKKYKCTEIKQE